MANGKEQGTDRALPPYIPFKTFTNFLQKMKETVIPPRIDSSLLRSYPGSIARQLKAALKYMALIDTTGNTSETLKGLVKAYATPAWREQFAEFICKVYHPVTEGLDVDTATLGQLQQKFRDQGADGQMLQKCITFYLAAYREGGMTISPHFTERLPRKAERATKGKPKRTDVGDSDSQGVEDDSSPTVKFSFPIPEKASALIVVPADLGGDDWAMIDSMIRAYVQRREKKN